MRKVKNTFFFWLLCVSSLLAQSNDSATTSDSARPKTSSEVRNSLLGEFFAVSDTGGGIRLFWVTIARQLQHMPPRDLKTGSPTKVELTQNDTKLYAIEFLMANYNEDLVRQANEWYVRPETVRLFSLLSSPYFGYQDYIANYKLAPSSKLRRELILRLSGALCTIQQTKALFELNGLTIGTVTSKLPVSIIESNTSALYDVQQWELQESAILRLSFCFRDISDAELESLVTNVELPIGQWATAYSRGAMLDSISRSIQDIRYRLTTGSH